MKITGPQTPQSPEAAAIPATEGKGDKGFTAKLEKSRSAQEVSPTETELATRVNRLSDIAAELQAGKCTQAAALDKVVERVLDQRLGVQAPAAVREQVGAALRTALAEDPFLAARITSLRE